MDPVIFKISQSFELRWYGVMAMIAFVVAVIIAQKNRKYFNMTKDQTYNLVLTSMISGVLGARIFYVIEFWNRGGFSENPLNIIMINKGGLVFYGGFIMALACIYIFTRRNKLEFLSTLSFMAPSLALGHAISRIGCFLNGCCYGKPTNLIWGYVYPSCSVPGHEHPGVHLHPVQLYETAGNIVIFFILQKFIKKNKSGQVAGMYMILYGILRFSDEFFRGDHTDFTFGLFTPAQTICFFIIPVGIALYIYSSKKAQNVGTETPVDSK